VKDALALRSRPLTVLRPMLAPAHDLGPCPVGRRKTVPVVGGTFDGERLRGEILPEGGDWAFMRPDDVLELDVRLTLKTHDGALIHCTYRGVRHGPPEVVAALTRGEDVDPAAYYFRIVPRFETSAPAYQFLNRIVAVGVGARRPSGPEYSIHEIL